MAIFVSSHIAVARTNIKPYLIERFGIRAYLSLYSALSLALLAWVIYAVLTAERVVLWNTPSWSYGFAVLLSAVAFVLAGMGALSPNPLSVAFRRTGFNASRPGIVGWVRHPMVIGLALWGIAHVPANGDWPSLVLFGGSAVFGLLGVFAVERRRKRRLGDNEWYRLTRGRGNVDRWMILGTGVGLALWATFLLLHPTLFGANPLGAALGQFR